MIDRSDDGSVRHPCAQRNHSRACSIHPIAHKKTNRELHEDDLASQQHQVHAATVLECQLRLGEAAATGKYTAVGP